MFFGALTGAAAGKKLTALVALTSALGLGATPAIANSAASAADTFRIGEPAQLERDVTALGEADGEFRSLFTNWGFAGPVAMKPATSVSVPALYPVDMGSVRTSSGFGARKAPLPGASRNHKGIDLAAPIGTPIYATADGRISKSGWGSGYGKLVFIDHGNGIETRYAHMSARSVFEGDTVKKGDVIGYVGSTCNSTGPHLHYEVRLEGVAVNPVSFMIEDPAAGGVRLAAQ